MTIDTNTGEVLDAKKFKQQQDRMAEQDIKREQADTDARFDQLTAGFDDQAFAELRQLVVLTLDEALQPLYLSLDPRKSRTLKTLIVQHLEKNNNRAPSHPCPEPTKA